MSGSDRRKWARMAAQAEHVIDSAGADNWTHPGDAMDDADPRFRSAPNVLLGQEAEETFKRIVLLCLPPLTYGRVRRYEVGYRRWVVLVYQCAPELFNGMTKQQLAKHLGITRRALMLEFVHVRQAVLPAQRPLKHVNAKQKL